MSRTVFELWGVSVELSDLIALGALAVAFMSNQRAKRALSAKNPSPAVEVDFEAFDTRDFQTGRFSYFHHWSVTNRGGSTVTVRGFRRKLDLPIVVPVKGFSLMQQNPVVTAHRPDPGMFENSATNPSLLEDLAPLSNEEMSSLNLAVPAGETRAIPLLLRVSDFAPSADAFILNLVMEFSDGSTFDAKKMVRIN